MVLDSVLGSEELPFDEWKEEFDRAAYPMVNNVSYGVFKTLIRPILGADVTESKYIYHDPEISPAIQSRLRRADLYGFLYVSFFSIAAPWELSRYITAFMQTRSFRPRGIGLLDKSVLAWAAGLCVVLFPVSQYIGDQIPFLRLSTVLCGDSESDQLGVYRKRLFDARPDLMGKRYIESRMREYDGVKDPRVKQPEKKIDE